jgi:hypothetical protein
MAIHLPDDIKITDWDEHRTCPFCVIDRAETDPDDMDRWAAHLTTHHGYRVVDDRPRPVDEKAPRTIRLQLAGWSSKAKFQPNVRVDVKTIRMMRPMGYAGRRGTIVGWNAGASEYAVAFDEEPILGWLPSSTLEPFVKRS